MGGSKQGADRAFGKVGRLKVSWRLKVAPAPTLTTPVLLFPASVSAQVDDGDFKVWVGSQSGAFF